MSFLPHILDCYRPEKIPGDFWSDGKFVNEMPTTSAVNSDDDDASEKSVLSSKNDATEKPGKR